MEGILPLLLWGGLFFLMMRFGCGAHIMGHGHGKGTKHSGNGETSTRNTASAKNGELVWTPPKEDVDPVCGKTVDPTCARSSVFHGWVYYFCSSQCRDAFEAAPETFNAPKHSALASTQRLEDNRQE